MFRKSVMSLALGAMFVTVPQQTQQMGARWLAFQGCWRQADSAQMGAAAATTQIVCVVPGNNSNTAELVTVDGGRVAERTLFAATGEAVVRSEGGCVGTERASWSSDGKRVYLRVDQSCEGGNKRSASGVMTILTESEWLDVQAVTVSGQKSVRVIRYSEVADRAGVPDEITTALRSNALSSRAARIAASAPITAGDIIDASRNLDAAAVEAWMVEAQQDIRIDGKELVRLSKSGVSSSVTDLLVALAYPKVFAVDHSALPTSDAQRAAASYRSGVGYGSGVMYNDYYDPFYYDPFGRYDPYNRGGRYGSSFYNSYGFNRYGNRYYANYAPVIIVVKNGSTVGVPDPEPQPRGRVINGQGYTRGGSGSSGASSGGSSSGSSRTGSSGSSGSSGSGSTSSGSGSTGSSTGRTAVPKTVPPPM